MHCKNPGRTDRRLLAAAALAALAGPLMLAPLAAFAQAAFAQAAVAQAVIAQAAIARNGQRFEIGTGQPPAPLALNGDSAGTALGGLTPGYYRRHFQRGADSLDYSLDHSLDYRIRRISRDLDRLDRDPDFPTLARPLVPPSGEAHSMASDLVPLPFRVMSLLSIALAAGGLAIVLCNRPELNGIRGKNDSRDARRTLVRCVVVLLVLNAADLGFTSFLVPSGAFIELNPLADMLTNSLPMLIAAKSAVIGACAVLFLAFWRHQIAQLASWGAAATYVLLAMWWVMYFHAATS